MRLDARSLGPLAAMATALAAGVARADLPPSCGWVQSIQHWDASFGWSWSHSDNWSALPNTTFDAQTQDAGSGTASLDGFLSGDVDGQLQFDDNLKQDDLDVVTFEHTVLSGPIVGGVPGVPSHLFLQIDGTACSTEVACGANGASVPVEKNTAYRVQVQRTGQAGTGALQVTLAPEPGSVLAAMAALGGVARARRRVAARGHSSAAGPSPRDASQEASARASVA